MSADPTVHADALHAALREAAPIAPLTGRVQGLDLAGAYAIAQAGIARRVAEGERVVGRKIGLTSAAVQRMLGVDQPDFGVLTDRMDHSDRGAVAVAGMIAPRAEGEIAFHLKRDLAGPGIGLHDVLLATESVSACFEIVDSRIRDWKIGILDTVADNASAAAFVTSRTRVALRDLDLGTCGMVLEKNGALLSTGAGAAALGSPLNCVVWLANQLGRLGDGLRAGDTVLSGALVPLTPVVRGDHLRLRVGGLGALDLHFD
ncbi:2-oxopent-4-enoate hydratase [Luteimonas sp. S4-F44]|uniref:fumarylacetoacetate hydrolase family protein n=1 Tax=Luteimonas sp. S4-F44 TaxID=2925842 RepID=UPI001F53DAA5|nr:fumarylacetoacetate hydrolase family protein [Luteimonas sp. S4-F44]UNK42285.1 2-oxopent-4-enoate hydratase [Luteimonas sp. S4-F44]